MKEGTVFTVMILPRPWPPQVNLDLFLSEEGNFRFRLFADTEGRLILEMSSSEGVKMYRFQPLIVEGGGRAIIIIRWSSQEADLRLNGKPVLLDEHAKGESLTLQTKDEPFPSQDLIVGDVDLSATKSDVDRLFLGTVIDIDGRVQEVSWYNLIRAAGLLWQLFLDEYPLVHAVNRMYKQKLEFYTLDYTKRPPISPEFEWIGLDPSLFPDAKTMRNDLGDFLKAPCLISGGVTATVQDLIGAVLMQKVAGIWVRQEGHERQNGNPL